MILLYTSNLQYHNYVSDKQIFDWSFIFQINLCIIIHTQSLTTKGQLKAQLIIFQL